MARGCCMQRDALADSTSCFLCGQLGHIACTCSIRRNAPTICMPQGNQQKQRATGKVFTVTE